MPITRRQLRPPPWLLLVFRLPAGQASRRVTVWRQLQRFGAVPLRNSGYLLPNRAETRERFEWLATSIRKHRGEASIVEVQSIDNLSPEQIAGRFLEARARDYRGLIRELHRRIAPSRQAARLRRLRHRFQEIYSIDFFPSPIRVRVEELLQQAQLTTGAVPPPASQKLAGKDFRGRVWVTRPRPGIDRSASAWLIRRWIDPKARFAFATEGHAPPGAVPFDMFHGGFGHRGEDCTFETLQKAFRIRNHRVGVIAQIIHDADLLDEKFGRKEGFGIDEVLKGWARQGLADQELLTRGMQLIEGLYHSLP